MAKLTSWKKKELLRIYKNRRITKRCILVKGFINESHVLTRELDISIDNLETELNNLKKEKQATIDKNGYGNLVPQIFGCSTKKEHPTLKAFDDETNSKIENIIRGDDK